MTWTLIMLLVAGPVVVVPGISTREDCEAAAKALSQRAHTVLVWTCAPSGHGRRGPVGWRE